MKMKSLGIVAGLGIVLIILGLVAATIPIEVDCSICDGSGKTDCLFCSDGSDNCIWCDGTGWKDCLFCIDGKADCAVCEDGKVDCIFCTDGCEYCNYQGWKTCTFCNGQGWKTCTFCNGDGGETCGECGGDGLVDCIFCNGRGWDTCAFCDGAGKKMSYAGSIVLGAILIIIGILLVPTAFIISARGEKQNEKND